MAVADLIANTISSFVSTILTGTDVGRDAGGGHVELTVVAPERYRAVARVIRRLALWVAAAPMLAGAAGTARLTVLRAGAEAAGPRGRMHTLLPFPALHLSTAALAFGSREAWRTTTNEAIGHVAGHSTSPSI